MLASMSHPNTTPAPPATSLVDRATGAGARLLAALRDETAVFAPAKVAAQALSGALPHLTFSRTRTMLLRGAGFAVSARAAW